MARYKLRRLPAIGSYAVVLRSMPEPGGVEREIGSVHKFVLFGVTGWVARDRDGQKIEGRCDQGRWSTRAQAADAVLASWDSRPTEA